MSDFSKGCALECINVAKSFPIEESISLPNLLFGLGINRNVSIVALKDISMFVPKGKIVGILGKNGAGKSTLLRVLAGVYEPSHGCVISNGNVAGLFELGGMGNPNLSGKDYAAAYLRFMGVGRVDIPALLEEICEFSELDDAFDRFIRTYSTGMAARLYFATVTAIQKDIYLIDELLSVGDAHFQVKCWQRMRQKLLNGASGVLVTHDWSAALKLCEESYVLEKGVFTYFGESDKAVISYLNIPRPQPSFAKISPLTQNNHVVQSGIDSYIELYVELAENISVNLAISIEMMNIGVGWEIVFLVNDLPVADKVGLYKLTVVIPKCPLIPGSYSLGVVLSKRKKSPQDSIVILDNRSWTLGNGYTLVVEGDYSGAAMVRIPYAINKIE